VTRHTRFVSCLFFLAAIGTAVFYSPDVSAAQGSRAAPRTSSSQGSRGAPPPSGSQGSQARPRPPGSGSGVAVPRPPYQYRPYYYPRYGYPSYYRGYGYPYYYRGYGYPWYGYYGYPGFYAGYPYSWGIGFGIGFGYPYGYGYGSGQYPYPSYYYGPYYDNTGSARLQVSPRNTQVYIDGYFVGVVDNFDGNLQRLHVEAGEHELQLYLEGHRTFTQKVLFPRGGTLKVMHTMQPLGPGESAGPPPQPDPARRAVPQAGMEVERQGPPPQRAVRPSEFGSLLLRVRPADADIIVDGEVWTAPAGEDQFVIELSEGPHRIEVRKDGFQAYATTVRVRPGETVRLNVSLTRGGLAGAF
jgi:PEGA domain